MPDKSRILLVDDEQQFATAISAFLHSKNHDVVTAGTAEEALELIFNNEFDLLITDINMPDMDGIELIRKVRTKKANQKIVIITGFPSHESQEEAFKMGVINYLVKPFALDRFLEVVTKALRGNGRNGKGLHGPVELTCEDLIQMHALSGRSLLLEIINEDDTGRIYFKNGKVIHAETAAHKGDEAFYEILSWETGIFKTESLETEVEATINQSVEGLLLEAARLKDETNNQKGMTEGGKTGKKEGKKQKIKEDSKEPLKPKRRQSMPSMVEEINEALKELAANTPGLGLALLVDNEGLPIARHTAIEIGEGTAEKSAVASLALLGLARRTADQLDLSGFQEVLVKADTGYIYSLSVGGPSGYVLVTRTDQNVTLGALFMTVRSARDRINRAMGVAPQA